MRTIETHVDVEEGLVWLCDREPRFAAIADALRPLPLRRRPEGFGQLISAILGQQVSVASAQSTWVRMVEADMVTAPAVSRATPDALRALGLSRQKALYAQELARADIDFDALREKSDADVIECLTAVKGIGPWTAEIYVKFSLGRADVFAAGDLALQIAAQDIFDLPKRPSEKELHKLAQDWSPWRSVAARLLWAYYADMKQRDGIR